MSELPSGTVSFLFTDIEGSTNLAQKYPQQLPALLSRHNAILEQAIESHHGTVFRMAGDAFCAAFSTPADALEAALTAQRGLQHEPWNPTPVWVRMGLHTGAARLRSGDSALDPYDGYLTLTRVQRVMSGAHGGQILLSDATAGLVRGELPPAVSLRNMGEHKLKGLPQPEALWQVVAPELRADFAPLDTLDMPPSNLPTALTTFIGRERELREVKTRLAQTRLLTLLGPGGTGKTRLALQAARELRDEWADRVYLVDLAASRDANAALGAIARTLDVRETDKPLLQELKDFIKQTKMLLVLDNFEQVVVAAQPMAELLAACPGLKLLITSREALQIRGETVLPIPPLGLPSEDLSDLTVAEAAKAEAVQLFVERARAVKPDFELTAENAAAVAEICVRLDGLPLAIELATARLAVFTPSQLAQRLGNRLKLLKGGARDLPLRQQTLAATIDWSYELLDHSEQLVFQLLSVFAGATFDEIIAVANAVGCFEDSESAVLDGVTSLVNKSLVRQEIDAQDQARFRMLETIREFAAAHLAENPTLQADAVRAHAVFFADLTQQQWSRLTGSARQDALAKLTADLENIQTAWRYWVAERNPEQLNKFTDTLWLLYDTRGWYHATLQLTTDLLVVLRATAFTPERAGEEISLQISLARALMATHGYTPEVEQAYARALELCEREGQVPGMLPVLRGLAFYYLLIGEFEKSLKMGERILELAAQVDDLNLQMQGNLVCGEALGSLGKLSPALEHLDRALEVYDPQRLRQQRRRLGSDPGVIVHNVSAFYLYMQGYADRARKRGQAAITLAEQLAHPFSLCYAHFHNGLLNFWLGKPEVAHASANVLLDVATEQEYSIWSVLGVCLQGAALALQGLPEQGLPMMVKGINAYRDLKTPPIFLPLLLSLCADAYARAGEPAAGLALAQEALAIAGPRGYGVLAPLLLALQARLLLACSPDNAAQAETLFREAVASSRNIGAPLFELLSAAGLAAVWQQQGKLAAARELLQSAYDKLPEGFDLPEVQQAHALLEELSKE